jgi:hypothetical protein
VYSMNPKNRTSDHNGIIDAEKGPPAAHGKDRAAASSGSTVWEQRRGPGESGSWRRIFGSCDTCDGFVLTGH